jgi:predicted ATPase
MGGSIMKRAQLIDCRKYIDEFKRFSFYMTGATISGVDGIEDSELRFSSALTSICGRNGVGKTSLLKLIYKVLTKEDLGLGVFHESNIDGVSVELFRKGKAISIKSTDDLKLPNVFYFDPSTFALKIIDEYKRDKDRNGWLNGAATYDIDAEELAWVNKITGKAYNRIIVNEISNIIDDVTFPYFEVSSDSGNYCTHDMGQGEHKILIIVWKLLSLEKESILIMEEPESFICPVSQFRLMDFIVAKTYENKLNILMSTHSEHILKDQGIRAINVMSLVKNRKIGPDHFKALVALGLTPEKKSVLLVEDAFAKLVLEVILKAKLPDHFRRSYIHVLAGESNIQMLSKHYFGITGLNFIAVYDADQIRRSDDFPLQFPKVFLPSVDKLPPELEVIRTVKQHALLLAERIDFTGDHHEFEAIVERTTSDPHDFFIDLVAECERAGLYISLGAVKLSSVNLWMHLNISIIDRFVFELQNSAGAISVDVLDKEQREARRFGTAGDSLTYEIESRFDSFPSGRMKGELIHSKESEKIMIKLCD